MIRLASIVFGLVAGLTCNAARAADPPLCTPDAGCILVFRIEPKAGVKKEEAEQLAGLVASALGALVDGEVETLADARRRIDAAGERAEVRQCDEFSCLLELGNALGVPLFVSGDAGRLGPVWTLNLAVSRTADNKPVGRVTLKARGDLGSLVDAIDGPRLKPLVERIPGLVLRAAAGAATPAAPPPPGSAPPPAARRVVDFDDLPAPRAPDAYGDTAPVRAVAVSRNGAFVASGNDEGVVRVYDRRNPRTAPVQIAGHSGRVSALGFSRDADRVVSGGADGAVRVVRTNDGLLVRALTGHTGAVVFAAFAADGRVISAGTDGTVRLWAGDGAPLATYKAHNGDITAAALEPADGALLTVSSGGRAVLTTLADGKALRRFGTEVENGALYAAAVSPDREIVVTGNGEGGVRAFRYASGAPLWRASLPQIRVHALAFIDSVRVAAGLADGRVYVLRAADGALLTIREGHTDAVFAAAAAPGRIAVSAGADGFVRVIDERPPP